MATEREGGDRGSPEHGTEHTMSKEAHLHAQMLYVRMGVLILCKNLVTSAEAADNKKFFRWSE